MRQQLRISTYFFSVEDDKFNSTMYRINPCQMNNSQKPPMTVASVVLTIFILSRLLLMLLFHQHHHYQSSRLFVPSLFAPTIVFHLPLSDATVEGASVVLTVPVAIEDECVSAI